jgi:hypothetical protein
MAMPITPFLRGQAFNPETVEAMGKAFVFTCEALGISDRTDPAAELIAKKIIELAQRGLRNPTALSLTAREELAQSTIECGEFGAESSVK